MQSQRFLGAVVALALLSTGCSGNASVALPVARSSAARVTGTSLVVRIPHRPKKRGHYLSPATQSLALTITPAGACTVCTPSKLNANLTPGSPGCVDAAGGTTCTVALDLSPGTYMGALSTYDGPLAAGTPTGKPLSIDQSFPVNVVLGQANVARVTLSGVPAGIRLIPATSNIGVITLIDPTNPVVVIAGSHARARLEVLATDADGNLILGAGAPAFTATAGGGIRNLG